ncbi:MAG: hypothetical protein AAGF07_03985 [Patescibacteria group bacterium]
MNKISKLGAQTTLAFLSLSSLALSLTGISVSAETWSSLGTARVASKYGLKLRDKECVIIKKLEDKAEVIKVDTTPDKELYPDVSLQCELYGTTYEMQLVRELPGEATGYVAIKYLKKSDSPDIVAGVAGTIYNTPLSYSRITKTAQKFYDKDTYEVNNDSGLWLRDTELKLVEKVANGTKLENASKCSDLKANAEEMEAIKAMGLRWTVIPVCYKGELMKTVDALLK